MNSREVLRYLETQVAAGNLIRLSDEKRRSKGIRYQTRGGAQLQLELGGAKPYLDGSTLRLRDDGQKRATLVLEAGRINLAKAQIIDDIDYRSGTQYNGSHFHDNDSRLYPGAQACFYITGEMGLAELLREYSSLTQELDREALNALKREFLRKFEDFESRGGFKGVSKFHESDHHKQTRKLLNEAEEVLQNPEGHEDLGATLLDLVQESKVLHGPMNGALTDRRKANPGLIEKATANLMNSDSPLEGIMSFIESTWDQAFAGDKSTPYTDSRTIPSTLAALQYPQTIAPVLTARFNNLHDRLFESRLFPTKQKLTRDEMEQANDVSRQIFDIMRDDWGWHPRDLWDVRAFVWETCEGKGQSESGMTNDAIRAAECKEEHKPTNLILYGPPGTGKTYHTLDQALRFCGVDTEGQSREDLKQAYDKLRNDKRIEFVTFHQNFAYEEFVEGLRPETGSDTDATGAGGFRLKPQPGIFREICKRAEEALKQCDSAPHDAPETPAQYVLVIDEINRANTSKVFGELITLIEPDKRLGMDEELKVRLPYSGEEFGVPANLHIIGTMNTADRSIALLDTALRRRFQFKEMAPDTEVEAFKVAESATRLPLARVLKKMNERIEYLIDRDHRIGHAFFVGCEKETDVDGVMRDKIIPLLQEYFFDDWNRLAAVLGEQDKGGNFLECRIIKDPMGGGEEEIKSWSVKAQTANESYDYGRIISGKEANSSETSSNAGDLA